MEQPRPYVIPRWYYVMTPAFILLDYVAGVNVRIAVLDALPVYKSLYYGFCVLCGVIVYVWPRASAVVALVESLIMVLMTLSQPFLFTLAMVGGSAAIGGEWQIEQVIGLQGAVNLLLSGTIAVVAFRLNAAALARRHVSRDL